MSTTTNLDQLYSSLRDSCVDMLSKSLDGYCYQYDNRPKTWTTILLEVIKDARWETIVNTRDCFY